MPSKSSVKKKAVKRAKPKTVRAQTRSRTPLVSQSIKLMQGGTVVGILKTKRASIDSHLRINQINSPQQFVAELQKIQAQLAELKHTPELKPADMRRIEMVEADTQEVIEETKKTKPLGERIHNTLVSATTTMEDLGKGIKTAVDLGGTLATLGQLSQLALKIFGH